MLNALDIAIRNFLRIGSITQSVVLNRPGLTLVLGQNHDADAANSRNGVGKSSLLQAVSYAVFDKALTDFKKDNLINDINQKGMLVVFRFERDGVVHRVERGRKPNLLRYFIGDDGVDHAQGENKHTQEDIEAAFGMSHLMFQHIVALNTFTDPFLKMKAADQRELIEELLGITQMSRRAASLKERVAETKLAIRDEETTLKATQDSNSRIEAIIERARLDCADWERQHDQIVRDLEDELEALAAIDFAADLATFDALDEWNRAQASFAADMRLSDATLERIAKDIRTARLDISKLDQERNQTSDPQIRRLEAERDRLLAESQRSFEPAKAKLVAEAARLDQQATRQANVIETLINDLAKVEAALETTDSSNCPTCGQGLHGTDHLNDMLDNLAKQADRIVDQMTEAQARQTVLQQEAETVRASIVSEEAEHQQACEQSRIASAAVAGEIIQAEAALQARKVSLEARQVDLEMQIDDLTAESTQQTRAHAALSATAHKLGPKPAPLFSSREELFALQQSRDGIAQQIAAEQAKTNPHEQQIAALRQSLQPVSFKTLEDLNLLQKHHDFLLRLLTGKDSFVRKKIVEQNLSLLNSRVHEYLTALASPHGVRLMPDLSIEITSRGRDYDFGQLSRGEMNRVILATSWAFRDVWESMNMPINLLLVDEVADTGMDEAGAEAVALVLNKMAMQRGKAIFLISHKEGLMGKVDRVLNVHRTDGFTSFEEEAEVLAA